MKRELKHLQVAEIIDDTPLSLSQICRSCQVSADQILELVEHAVVEPIEWQSTSIYFNGGSLHRINCALRLKRDLGLNIAGTALALELLDELSVLRERLKRYEE